MYGTKATGSPIRASSILFLPRIMDLIQTAEDPNVSLDLFLTGRSRKDVGSGIGLPEGVTCGRITEAALEAALGKENDREQTVCYVCGPPRMTDSFVDYLRSQKGMDENRVLCEKWW